MIHSDTHGTCAARLRQLNTEHAFFSFVTTTAQRSNLIVSLSLSLSLSLSSISWESHLKAYRCNFFAGNFERSRNSSKSRTNIFIKSNQARCFASPWGIENSIRV
jgi:hypothetical protein